MPLHSELTGAELHELKGADTALINTLPVADGAGGTAFQKVGVDQIDLSSIVDPRLRLLTVRIPDISSSVPVYMPCVLPMTLLQAQVVAEANYAGANPLLTVTRNDSVTVDSWTPDLDGMGDGATMLRTIPVTNALISSTGWFRIAASTSVDDVPMTVTFLVRLEP